MNTTTISPYPYFSLVNDNGESIWVGRDIMKEYFYKYDINFFKDYRLFLVLSLGQFVDLGTLSNMEKIPSVYLEYKNYENPLNPR